MIQTTLLFVPFVCSTRVNMHMHMPNYSIHFGSVWFKDVADRSFFSKKLYFLSAELSALWCVNFNIVHLLHHALS